MNMEPVLLNLGCGRRFHPAWRNLDLAPGVAGVERWSAFEPIPAPEGSVDVCYSSHMLEHLSPARAVAFVAECHRVLKPGGILRLVVPDLEGIARNYLVSLELGDPARHAWATIELLDQMTRDHCGGMAAEFIRAADGETRRMIRERWGAEAAALDQSPPGSTPPRAAHPLRRLLGAARDHIAARLGGVDLDSLRAARFRRAGEIHRWMYDRKSLARLVESQGFVEAGPVSASGGRIAGWREFQLDCDTSGEPHKPDSLFLEAVKPTSPRVEP